MSSPSRATSADSAGLTAVIPIFNCQDFVVKLATSLESSAVSPLLNEILWVDDGSEDGTLAQIQELQKKDSRHRILPLTMNLGRFQARWMGAREAKSEFLLFLDARVELGDGFGLALSELLKKESFLQPQPRLNLQSSLFTLYWQRTHERIFRQHYEKISAGPFYLDSSNYDQFLKGTGVLIAPRSLFLDSCAKYAQEGLLSDDTFLMKDMVQNQPLRVSPELWFWWRPRESAMAFFARLIERGPGLVEYHIFARPTWVGLVVMITWIIALANLALLILNAQAGLMMFLALVVLSAVSVLVFARTFLEVILLLPLHLGTIASTFLGTVWGLWVNGVRWIKGQRVRD